MGLRQVLYISSAPGLTDSDIADILASSRTNNPERGITGFLLYNGRNFMQLLEGEEADLRWLLSRLSSDPRHTGVVRLADEVIGARACGDWTMQQVRLVDDVTRRRASLDEQLPRGLNEGVRTLVMNFAALN